MIVNIILGFIIPFILIVAALYLIKTFRSNEVIKWVGIAVKAAEQIYSSTGQGKEKFGYASKWISEKFNVSEADLRNIIESAVYELNNTKKDTEQKE